MCACVASLLSVCAFCGGNCKHRNVCIFFFFLWWTYNFTCVCLCICVWWSNSLCTRLAQRGLWVIRKWQWWLPGNQLLCGGRERDRSPRQHQAKWKEERREGKKITYEVLQGENPNQWPGWNVGILGFRKLWILIISTFWQHSRLQWNSFFQKYVLWCVNALVRLGRGPRKHLG